MENSQKKQLEGEDFEFDIDVEGDDLFASQQLPHGFEGTDWESVDVPDVDVDAQTNEP